MNDITKTALGVGAGILTAKVGEAILKKAKVPGMGGVRRPRTTKKKKKSRKRKR